MSSKANLIVGALLLLCWSFTFRPISGYQEVKLTKFTPAAYSSFITAVRNAIPNGGQKDGIRFLPVKPAAPVPSKGKGKPIARAPANWANEFLLVTLKADERTLPVTFAIQMTDLYVAGYKVGTNAWIFKDFSSHKDKLFPEATNKVTLTYESSYNDLEKLGGGRNKVTLGVGKLKEAAIFLPTTPAGTKGGSKQQASKISEMMIVVIEMVAEATRFKYIERQIVGYGNTNQYPNNEMLKYMNDWYGAVRGTILKAAPGQVPKKLLDDVYIIKPPK